MFLLLAGRRIFEKFIAELSNNRNINRKVNKYKKHNNRLRKLEKKPKYPHNDYMENYLYIWLSTSTRIYKKSFKSISSFLISKIAIRENLENIFKPLFQDYTREGRVIGFILRSVRILFGVILYLLVGLVLALAYVIWTLLPLIFLIYLIGGIFGA